MWTVVAPGRLAVTGSRWRPCLVKEDVMIRRVSPGLVIGVLAALVLTGCAADRAGSAPEPEATFEPYDTSHLVTLAILVVGIALLVWAGRRLRVTDPGD